MVFNEKAFDNILDAGTYLAVRWWYYKIMDADLAPYFAYLHRQKRHYTNTGKIDDGWFPCSSKEMQNIFGIDDQAQMRRLRALKKAGFIQIKMRGKPKVDRCRWVRIQSTKVFKALQAAGIELSISSENRIPSKMMGNQNHIPSNLTVNRAVKNDGSLIDRRKENKSAVACAPAARARNGFFEELEENDDGMINTKMAEQLRLALAKKNKTNGGWSKKKWSEEFAKLREYMEDDERIKKVFNWYLLHIAEDRWIPQAWCAKSFRKRFIDIEAQMNRRKEDSQEEGEEEVELTKDVQTILEAIKRKRNVPHLLEKKLPSLVQQTYDDYVQFYNTIHILAKRHKKKAKKEGAWIGWEVTYKLMTYKMDSPYHFTEQWFLWALEQIENWGNWGGSWKPFKFHLNHSRFTKILSTWTLQIDNVLKDVEKEYEE